MTVFESRVLRKVFGTKRNKMIKDWRKLHNEVFHNLCSSPNIIRMIKLGRLRWARSGVDWIHVAQDRYPWRILVNKVMNQFFL
jgi:hypothetical protein